MKGQWKYIMLVVLLIVTGCTVYLQNQSHTLAYGMKLYSTSDTLIFKTNSGKLMIESVGYNGVEYPVQGKVYHFPLTSLNGGLKQLNWCFNLSNGKKIEINEEILVVADNPPEIIKIDTVMLIPHDEQLFTQGLEFYDGFLYESAGQYGQSTISKINPLSGQLLAQTRLDSSFFAEGLTFSNDTICLLTWKEQKLFRLDTNLNVIDQLKYHREGWGLCKTDRLLVASDGSDQLCFFTTGDATVQKTLTVYNHKGTVALLNELEWIDNYIWANVLGQDFVAVIDPETGRVIYEIDFSELIEHHNFEDKGVFNGLAYQHETGKLFFTGKNWPYYLVIKMPDQIKK